MRSHKICAEWRFGGGIFAVIVALLFCCDSRAETTIGDGYSKWTKFRDHLRKDPSLLAYYTFEKHEDFTFPNYADSNPDATLLSHEVTWQQGRWPQKNALTFPDRRSFLKGRFSLPIKGNANINTPPRQFSCEFWFRKNGPGLLTGNGGSKDGLIVSWYSGFFEGWRISAACPDGPVIFEIGRPKIGAVSVRTGPVKDKIWHHVVATWDGAEMCIYVNGSLSGKTSYAGNLTLHEPLIVYPIRLGFQGHWETGSGVGTLQADIDEFALFNRALTSEEIQQHYEAGNDFAKGETIKTFPTVEFACSERNGYFMRGEVMHCDSTITDVPGTYSIAVKALDTERREVGQGVAKADLALGQRSASCSIEFPVPDTCGIYWLEMRALDADGRVFKEQLFPFAVTVKLPPIAEVDEDSPLGGQHMVNHGMPEGRHFGLKWDRLWIGGPTRWKNIEKVKGTYDWSAVDKIVDEASTAKTPILYTIDGTPDWAKDDSSATLGTTEYPKDIADWDRFVRALVTRYKDRVHYWEILNEPNATGTGKEKVEAYVRMLKVAWKAIKDVDPLAKVVGIDGCPGNLVEWTDAVLAAGGGDYCDVISYHNYNYDNPNYWMQRRIVERIAESVRKHTGKSLPLWNTEAAFLQAPRVNSRPMTEGEYRRFFSSELKNGKEFFSWGFVTTVPERRAAIWEVEGCLFDLAAGSRKYFMHYGHKLLLCSEVSEKGVALAALSQVLVPYREAARLDLANPQANGVLVTRKDGSTVAALWAVDERPTRVFFLPSKERNAYKAVDFLGNPVAIGPAKEGVLNVNLSAEPVYIFLDAGESLKAVKIFELAGDTTLEPQQPCPGTLSVTNPYATHLSAELDVVLPDGWKVEIERSLEIEPGASLKIPFVVTASANANGVLPARFLLSRQKVPVADIERKYLARTVSPVARAKEPFVVDGNLKKWEGISRHSAASLEHVVIGRPSPMFTEEFPHWRNAKDLSFTAQFCWDAGSLFFLVTVQDDDLTPAPKGKDDAYNYDCVELFLHPGSPDSNNSQDKGTQLLIVPAVEEGISICRTLTIRKANGEFMAVGGKNQNGYFIEGQFTPKAGGHLNSGTTMSFDIAVDDDGAVPGNRKTQMFLFGRSENSFGNPSSWGRFRLAESEVSK
jgi:hypothetical protein